MPAVLGEHVERGGGEHEQGVPAQESGGGERLLPDFIRESDGDVRRQVVPQPDGPAAVGQGQGAVRAGVQIFRSLPGVGGPDRNGNPTAFGTAPVDCPVDAHDGRPIPPHHQVGQHAPSVGAGRGSRRNSPPARRYTPADVSTSNVRSPARAMAVTACGESPSAGP